jgi:membrane protease YdiL (CAAX protease family)
VPALKTYWKLSRAPRYSVTFALPLLILYQVLVLALSRFAGNQLRNGADIILQSFFVAIAGRRGPLLFVLVVIGVSIWFIARDLKRSGRVEWKVFAWMTAEAVLLALVFGLVVGTVTSKLLSSFHTLAILGGQPSMSLGARLMLSLGAGLYEELLFRVLLVSGLLLLTQRVMGMRPAVANIFAVGVSAVIFSAFHYIGPYGDPLRLDSFVFRAIAGVAFSTLYVFRGFGITAWTHALYDVLVLVF